MAPAVTRELSIAYGTVTVGGTSEVYLLDHSHPRTLRADYGGIEVSCVVQCRAASESAFVTACQALEAAYVKPNQALTITLGSQSWAWAHTTSTGFLARPRCEVMADPSNSARSCLYRLTVEAQRPADLTGKNSLREAQIRVTTDLSGLRTLELAGVYTATGSTAASTQCVAQYGTLLGTLESALTGTWERGDFQRSTDDEDKVCTFAATSLEVGYLQAVGSLDHAAIKAQTLLISRARLAPGDQPGAERLRNLVLAYDATIVRAQSTDLPGLYASIIKPHLLARARDVAGSSSIALVRDEPRYDRPGNRISATMELQAAGSSSVLMYSMVTEDSTTSGVELVPVWDGNPYARVKFEVPATWRRTIQQSKLLLGTHAPKSPSGGGSGLSIFLGPSKDSGLQSPTGLAAGGSFEGPGTSGGPQVYLDDGSSGSGSGGLGGGKWVLMSGTYRTQPYRIGLPDASMDVTEIVQTDTYEWAEAPKGDMSVGYAGSGASIPPPSGAGGSLPGPMRSQDTPIW